MFLLPQRKAKSSFTWNGYAFHEGTLVLLDIYGTNHDPNIWVNPDEFQPERFAQWQDDQFSFIPQAAEDMKQPIVVQVNN